MNVSHWVPAFALALACSLIGIPPAARAQAPADTLKRIAESKIIRFGYLKEGVPFSYADNDKPSGYSVDLCQRVAAGIQEQLNLQQLRIEWVQVTTANRFDKVRDGSIDLECGTSTNTVARQKQVDFSLMTWVDAATFLVKSSDSTRRLSELSGKRIAVLGGTTTERALRQALADGFVAAEVLLVKEHLDGLNAMSNGVAEAYAGDQTVLIGLGLAVGSQMPVTLAEQHFSYEPYGLVMRRNDADFKQAVNQVLARLYRSGKIIDIYDRWFGKLGKPSPLLAAMFGLNGLPD